MRFWKHSAYDGFMLLENLAQTCLYVWLVLTWEQRTWLEIGLLVPIGLFFAWLNPIITTHNFIHHPWFASKRMNRVYAAFNSINLCLPQILYRYQHLNHHRYENDRRNDQGMTRDYSSTYADGVHGRHENVFTYCTLALFKPRSTQALRDALAKEPGQYWFEQVVCASGVTALLLINWQFFLVFYLPTVYLGWCLAHMENYYEHFGANPENPFANSVSYYGTAYNFAFFNEGYHQEHHLRPQAHWTKRPRVHEEFTESLRQSDRHVSAFPPLLGFLERRPHQSGPPAG